MHRIRMHTRTGGCMQLRKPSYNASMYGIHDWELDSMQNSNGSEPHRYFFFRLKIGIRVLQLPNRKKVIPTCAADDPPFFHFERQVWRLEFRFSPLVVKRGRVERSIYASDHANDPINSTDFTRYLTLSCLSRGSVQKILKRTRVKYCGKLRDIFCSSTYKLRTSYAKTTHENHTREIIFYIKLAVF